MARLVAQYVQRPPARAGPHVRHVRSILDKLSLRDRPQAMVLAHECGLVQTG